MSVPHHALAMIALLEIRSVLSFTLNDSIKYHGAEQNREDLQGSGRFTYRLLSRR